VTADDIVALPVQLQGSGSSLVLATRVAVVVTSLRSRNKYCASQ